MREKLLFLLCLSLSLLSSLAVQLPLCSLAKSSLARQAGLLFPALWFLAALAAFGVDESNSFIRLGPAIVRWLSAMGLSALAGCGLAWLIHHIHRKRN